MHHLVILELQADQVFIGQGTDKQVVLPRLEPV